MTRKIQIAAFFLVTLTMLGLTGCPRHRHYRDHQPPPPPMHQDHRN